MLTRTLGLRSVSNGNMLLEDKIKRGGSEGRVARMVVVIDTYLNKIKMMGTMKKITFTVAPYIPEYGMPKALEKTGISPAISAPLPPKCIALKANPA